MILYSKKKNGTRLVINRFIGIFLVYDQSGKL